MKAHIGVDPESGLVHSVVGMAANINDVTQASKLLHGQERDAWGDAGYQGMHKRQEFEHSAVRGAVAMRPGKRLAPLPERKLHQLPEKAEKCWRRQRRSSRRAFGPRSSTRFASSMPKSAIARWLKTRRD